MTITIAVDMLYDQKCPVNNAVVDRDMNTELRLLHATPEITSVTLKFEDCRYDDVGMWPWTGQLKDISVVSKVAVWNEQYEDEKHGMQVVGLKEHFTLWIPDLRSKKMRGNSFNVPVSSIVKSFEFFGYHLILLGWTALYATRWMRWFPRGLIKRWRVVETYTLKCPVKHTTNSNIYQYHRSNCSFSSAIIDIVNSWWCQVSIRTARKGRRRGGSSDNPITKRHKTWRDWRRTLMVRTAWMSCCVDQNSRSDDRRSAGGSVALVEFWLVWEWGERRRALCVLSIWWSLLIPRYICRPLVI